MESVYVPFCKFRSKIVSFRKKYGQGEKKSLYSQSKKPKWEVEKIVILLHGILLIAVFTDMRKGKIPNRLIGIGILLGLLTADRLLQQFLLASVIFILMFPLFASGLLGAGDIKCFCMIAFYLEPGQFLRSILFAFLIAVLISFCILLKDFIFNKFQTFKTTHTIHLAGPIFLGVLISTGELYL